jgi:hypothetical protein
MISTVVQSLPHSTYHWKFEFSHLGGESEMNIHGEPILSKGTFRTAIRFCPALVLFFAGSIQALGVSGYVTTTAGGFNLVNNGVAATIYLDPREPPAVKRCAQDLATDIQSVTGVLPVITTSTAGLPATTIIAGTLDSGAVIQGLVSAGTINVSQVKGQWETYLIQTVANPISGVTSGLVIVGSDRRGAVYGMYDLSAKIGVSPWHWFADVTPMTQTGLYVTAGTTYLQGPPSVKYRGIFINDEDWCIRPWSLGTYDKADGKTGVGPLTYRKVFELLLRMKANYIWPAMHQDATPFNYYPINKYIADTFGIVMGSSHVEPMLRDVTAGTEWDSEGVGAFNYQTNRTNVYNFWVERAVQNGMFENVYSMGKRGNDDEPMPEGSTTAQKISILEEIFSDQQQIISTYVNPTVDSVPQVFIPYKEVLGLYYAGLVVPDNITLGWCDDNYGYIRGLSNATEQARSGGAGVYIHCEYWGSPQDYLWICTTPPSLLWEEMNKAWSYKAQRLWILNVGDIKPAEIEAELFLDMGWDITQCSATNVTSRMEQILANDFGAGVAPQIAAIMQSYYQLGFARRPEHMDSLLFSTDNYGDEAQLRLNAYSALNAQATTIYNGLPSSLQAAFYQMVLYPIRGAMLINEKFLYAQKSSTYGVQKRANASAYGARATQAYDSIVSETNYYNTKMSGGKWNLMMDYEPRSQPWSNPPVVSTYSGSGAANLNVWCEGGSATTLPSFSVYNQNQYYIDLYSTGAGSVAWKATPSASWIQLTADSGTFSGDQRIYGTINWTAVPTGTAVSGSIAFTSGTTTKTVTVPVFNPATPTPLQIAGFAESNGYISIMAEHFSRETDYSGSGWRVIPGLGRIGDAITVLPPTLDSVGTPALILTSSPHTEYDFYDFTTGTATVSVYALPNESVFRDTTVMRYAVSLDAGTPTVATVSQNWSNNVLTNTAMGSSSIAIPTTGQHTLKLWMVDPGLCVEKIVINTGGVKTSYLGPPESFVNQAGTTGVRNHVSAAAAMQSSSVKAMGNKILVDNCGSGDAQLSIFSMNGKLLLHERIPPGPSSLAMPSSAAGMHLFVLEGKHSRQTGKLVLSRW